MPGLRQGVQPLSSSNPSVVLVSITGPSNSPSNTNNATPDVNIVFDFKDLPQAGDFLYVYLDGVYLTTHTITTTEFQNGQILLTLPALSQPVTHTIQIVHNNLKGPAFSLTVNTTAPVLSSPSGAPSGTNDTQANLTVTSNVNSGYFYYIVTTSAITPTPTQVVNGQNSGGTLVPINGAVIVTSTSIAVTAVSLITGGTWHAYMVHQDLAGNLSAVATASWVQSPSTGFDILGTIAPDLYLAADNRFSLWQNIAGSTQVNWITGNNQYVGLWNDLSSHSFNMASQANTILASPKFDNTTFPSVFFDGVSTNLVHSTGALGLGHACFAGTGSTTVIALKPNPHSTTQGCTVFEDDADPGGESFFVGAGTDINSFNNSAWIMSCRDNVGNLYINNQFVPGGSTMWDNTWKVITIIDNGAGTVTFRANATQIGTLTYNHAAVSDSNNATAFSIGGNSPRFFCANIAQMVVKLSGTMSLTNVHNLETWLGAKIGLSI